MTYGAPLLTTSSKLDFSDCPEREVKELLDILLVDDVLSKNGLPTINQLLEMPFFSNTIVDPLPTSSVSAAASTSSASNSNNKLFSSSKIKELLIKSRELSKLIFFSPFLKLIILSFVILAEKRLNEEQKFVKIPYF